MHDDSCIGINYAHRFPKCFQVTSPIVGLFTLHFVSPIQLLSLYQLIQFLTCTRIPCRVSLRKWSCEVLSLHHPSFAADRSQLQTIQLQQNKGKIVKIARLRFCEKTALTTGLSVPLCRSSRVSSFVDFLVNCHEFHQESLRCHQLEEELDDGCHF